MSMLHSLIDQNHAHAITWLHGCRNESVHAFKDQLAAIVTNNPQVRQHVFYNQLTEIEKQAGILEGHLDINKVPELDLVADAHYFICGPTPFIQKQYNDLVEAGVNKQRIYFEEFGPQVLALN